MRDITDLLVGVDKLLSEHDFCEMSSARHQLSIAISLHKNQLRQAHRQGWEQCQREAKDKAEAFAHAGKLCCMEKADKIKDAIASMEYKGAKNG